MVPPTTDRRWNALAAATALVALTTPAAASEGKQLRPDITVHELDNGLVVYALFWLLAANVGSQWGVTHLEAGRASIIIIMELVTAVVTATWIGGERMDALEMFGGALIVMAATIEALRAAPAEAVAAQPGG